MARYFLHLRDGTEEVLDPEGVDYTDMEAVRRAVLAGARDVMANDLKSGGVLDLSFRIDAENGTGKIVHTLPFKHAVNIIPAA